MSELNALAHYSSIVAGEQIVVDVLAIIIISILAEKGKRKSTVYFGIACLVGAICLSADMIYWMHMAGKEFPAIVLGISTSISYSVSLIFIPLCLYMREYVAERTTVKEIQFKRLMALNIAFMLIMLYSIFTGKIFIIENGEFELVGGVPVVAKGLAVILILYLYVVFLSIRKEIGNRACLLLMSFGIIPVIFMTFMYDYTPVGTGLNLVIVYIFLQNNNSKEREEHRKELEHLNKELQDRQKKLEEYALRDMVSGCKNRNALQWVYELEFDRTQSFAVVMCDLNDLKKVNDMLGHDAGDSMIRECAALIVNVFGKENVYRIGGDEFIVVLTGFVEDDVLGLVDKARNVLGNKSSVGYVFKDCFDTSFDELVRAADAEMYKQKELYYLNNERYR